MKKIFFAIACIAFLTACKGGAENDSKSDAVNKIDEMSPKMAQSITLDFGAADVAAGKSGIYQLNVGGGVKGAIIEYVDFETKTKAALCSRLECVHDNDTCTAYISDATASIFTNADKSKIFVLSKVFKDQEYYQKISVMDVNGENRKDIYKFKANQETKIPNIIVEKNQKLYFMVEEISNIETLEISRSLIELDYNTGKCESIKDFGKETRIIGGVDNSIILEEAACLVPMGNTEIDPNTTIIAMDLEDKSTRVVYCYSLDLTRKEGRLNTYLINGKDLLEVSNEGWLIISKIDISTGEKSLVYENEGVKSDYAFSCYGMFEDKIILGYIDENRENKRVAFDIKTATEHPQTLEIKGEDKRKAYVTILAVYKDKFYVSVNSTIDEFEYLTKQGTYEKGRMTKLEKAFIDKNDYFSNQENYIFV